MTWPLKALVETPCRVEIFQPRTNRSFGPLWLTRNRVLTVLRPGTAAGGDAPGMVVCLHPQHGDGRCLAVPEETLRVLP